jgi:4-amino-4-deoxy-L-arabinose transferase-like glycosyltransferase
MKIKKTQILLLILFLFHLFLRFYQFQTRNPFGWDQVDNAWVAKDIIVDHKWPLLGMQAKGSSGFFIGPLYYYLVAVVYFFARLDPAASGIIAGISSIFTFWIFYSVIKKIFDEKIALIAVFIHTFSIYVINLDRTQWPVNLMAPISLIIFYLVYQIINGKEKLILWLAVILGLSFHLNFTSVIFPLMIIIALPLFPRTKKTLRYLLLSAPLFLLFFVPNFLAEITSKNVHTKNMSNYLQTYYHGLHLQRVFQVAKDAFIEFEAIFIDGIAVLAKIKPAKYLFLPLFAGIFYLEKRNRKGFTPVYLAIVWIFAPWLVFSVYSGEISNYYFSLTRPVVIITLAYLTYWLWGKKLLLVRVLVLSFWLFYAFAGIRIFLKTQNKGLSYYRIKVQEAIKSGRVIEFQQGVPESYLYYFYAQKNIKK